jgi:predicted Zn-dependent peptidase
MKQYISLIFILFFFLGQGISQEDFRKNAPAPGPAPRIAFGKANQFRLKNGLRVIVVENHKLPRINAQIFVDVPPFLEGESAGYASISGQLLNKGTKNRTKAQLDEEVDFIGASLSTSSSGVIGAALSKHKEKLFELMADVLLNPTFPESEFSKIKKQTLSSLAQAKNDPNTISQNVSAVLRNGRNHPFGEIETEASIGKVDLVQCINFYSTYFKPNISYFIITGDINTNSVKKLVNKYFGKWKPGPVQKTNFEIPALPTKTSVHFVDRASAVQSVINITYPVNLTPSSSNAIKASVMNTLLGGYFNSRLNSNLREDKGYTYGVNSSLTSDPVVGSFSVAVSVRNDVTDSAITEALTEMKKLRTSEVTDEELQMVKNVMTGSFARALENPMTVARFNLNIARFGLPADYYETYLEKISQVTIKDIKDMAMYYLAPARAHILVVGNRDEVADKLTHFNDKAIVNFYDAFGNQLAHKEESISDEVTAESIIQEYLKALGSPEDLNSIDNVKIEMSTNVQGVTIETTLLHKRPNKLVMVNKMMGNEIQKMVFDGAKGYQSQMGQTKELTGKELEDQKVEASLFPERRYKELGVSVSLGGSEEINGKKAYKITVQYPSGSKKTHFFDAASKLKVREVEYAEGTTVTNDISDYKVVNKVLFPHTVSISGALPVTIKMETKSITVSSEISDDIFK